ncbi:putative invertase inhibitor [Sesamum alatum]|uniref:Invertase inhibitor n=1 Tax=Sesamum alatum TaxID=300844 RepID=A0AAE2C9W2_9LAMI|nr:putative invertase inhibitor [Sesamum alatum]
MQKQKPFSLFFLSILIMMVMIMISGSDGQVLINSTCKTFSKNDPNIDYNFCTTSLQAAPASQCATRQGLGTIAIRLIRYNVTDTRCHIKQLLKNRKWDPYVRQCLSDCLELYSDAIPSVKAAMKNFNARRFDDANVQISSIMDASTTCEDGFKEKKGVVSPLSKRNGDTFQLSAVALSVMRMIQTESQAD